MVKSTRIWWAGHVAQMEKMNSYRILMGKPEETTRPKCRWVDNIKMDLREIEWMVWTALIGTYGGF
jgi:hypothetical protein